MKKLILTIFILWMALFSFHVMFGATTKHFGMDTVLDESAQNVENHNKIVKTIYNDEYKKCVDYVKQLFGDVWTNGSQISQMQLLININEEIWAMIGEWETKDMLSRNLRENFHNQIAKHDSPFILENLNSREALVMAIDEVMQKRIDYFKNDACTNKDGKCDLWGIISEDYNPYDDDLSDGENPQLIYQDHMKTRFDIQPFLAQPRTSDEIINYFIAE